MSRSQNSFILEIATALPKFNLEQKNFAKITSRLLNLGKEKTALINRFAKNSKIRNRYTVIQDFKKRPKDWEFFNPETPSLYPSTEKRNALYKKEAIELSLHSTRTLLKKWSGNPHKITHLIYVSCTGMMAPGVEFFLIRELGLSPSTQRIAINFMGCFGAFRALAVAKAIAEQDQSHLVLVVCTELCSLHVQSELKLDTIIGNSLFSDGSAALLVGCNPAQRPLWEVVKCGSTIIENSEKAMTWDIGERGFVMRLSHEIPELIKNRISVFINALVDNKFLFSQADWPIHPGGKAIVEAIEKTFQLKSLQTKSSWHILKEFGNMSSATFPFVLEHLSQKKRKKWAIGLGFGPGLSMEGTILKTCH